jgi:alpha-tubulin suppressor-like RCC1 family protein
LKLFDILRNIPNNQGLKQYKLRIHLLVPYHSYELIRMEQLIQKTIYSMFVLKNYLQSIVGDHAPYEIVRFITFLMYPKMSVACGAHHTLLLVDGDVYTWGSNNHTQLGLGHGLPTYGVQKLKLKHIEKVACGQVYNVALGKFGDIYSWGKISRKLSHPPTNLITHSLVNIIDIACGDYHNMALDTFGKLYSWGENDFGQLGTDLITTFHFFPEKIDLEDVISIACGCNNSMAMTKNGDIYVWGNNWYSQLGLRDTYDHEGCPQKFSADRINCDCLSPINPQNIQTICYGAYGSIILTKNGEIYSCGSNLSGNLGLEKDMYSTTCLTFEKIKIENVRHVSRMDLSTVVITTDNKIYVWGKNSKGQLGLGSTAGYRSSPCQLDLPNIITLSCGEHFTVAISVLGKIYVWGCNKSGELGLDCRDRYKFSPQKFPLIIKYDWESIRSK